MSFEKVNPCHPDKVADRIAGAIVDLAYSKNNNPKVAVEVLIGHGTCTVITETSELIAQSEVRAVVDRIAGDGLKLHYYPNQQDAHLAGNQADHVRCGDNGIFKGCPVTDEQAKLSSIARAIYEQYPTDGKYILANGRLMPRRKTCVRPIRWRTSTPWATGRAVPMWTAEPPTANSVRTWRTA